MKCPSLAVTVDYLLIGKSIPFGPNGEPSGIVKEVVSASTKITVQGFQGDEQGDLRIHGGIEKAIHHFPAEHYKTLKSVIPVGSCSIGGFGENISTVGLTEQDVCLGDVFKLGDATVQLSQGRQPCWKLNIRFNNPEMAKIIQQRGLTGWYYRVLEEGEISSKAQLKLIERPYPEGNLAQIQHYLHRDSLNFLEIEKCLNIPALPVNWRNIFLERLSTESLENTELRLCTPSREINSLNVRQYGDKK